MAASSSSAQDLQALPGPKPLPSSSNASRRLPPPCWSHDETVALIDSYRDKWYSLRRGNLRAPHWQEVADSIAVCCPINPPKTAVQCRHKMEKLRKRYRAEMQRAMSTPNSHRYSSSWVHFNRMDSMEKGHTASAAPVSTGPVDLYEDEEVEDDQDYVEALYQNRVKRDVPHNNRSLYGSISNGMGGGSGGGSEFRIKIPRRSTMGPSGVKVYSKFDEMGSHSHNPTPNYGPTKVLRDEHTRRFGLGKRSGGDGVGKRREGDLVTDMVSAIKGLGDVFVRMERSKMEMAREVEKMRMEMELKRTEMILESQQRLVEAFAKPPSERKSKKAKRMSTPES